MIMIISYCECFAARTFCDNCNCVGCCNTLENEDLVKKAVTATLERNAKAFRTKIFYTPLSVCFFSLHHSITSSLPFTHSQSFLLFIPHLFPSCSFICNNLNLFTFSKKKKKREKNKCKEGITKGVIARKVIV